MNPILIAGAAALLTYLLIFPIRLWSQKRLLDIPNERSSHSQPTPRGGGAAIVIVTLLGVVVFGVAGTQTTVYLITGVFIAAVGLLDDLHNLSPRARFLVQAVAALIVIIGGGYWTAVNLPLLGTFPLGIAGAALVFVWIIGLVNAYNFMDGTDGMAGGVGLIASIGWVVLPWASPAADFGRLVGLLLAGSCLGFLGHNWSPAKIFMGDVASTFLGLSFAVLPVLAAQDARAVLVGVLLIWPFLFDTVLTFIRRLRRGENVFAAHRSHLYQRLVIAGYSHLFVGLLYMTYTAIGVVMAWLWLMEVPGAQVFIVLGIPVLCIGHFLFVIWCENRVTTHSRSS